MASICLALLIFVPWARIIRRRHVLVSYAISVAICIAVALPMWNMIVNMFPNNSSSIINTIQKPDFTDKSMNIYFDAGGNIWWYTVSELENSRIEPCDFDEMSIPLQIYVDDLKWYVDVSLYAGEGLPPVQIEYNEFVDKPLKWDMNFNEGAFEVVNDKQEPIFQLIFRTQDKAIVNGFFPFGDRAVIICEYGIADLSEEMEIFKFNRIFKYPSNKYPGERR